MRNISFALTTPQFVDGSKDVTRRRGWKFLRPGDRLMGVKKAMGLKKGEKIEKLGGLEVVSARRERLDACTDEDAAREGFPELTGPEFVAAFCKHMNVKPAEVVTRIEFVRVPSGVRCESRQPEGLAPDGTSYPGGRCGLDLGHDGDHTLLMETSAPWFGKTDE